METFQAFVFLGLVVLVVVFYLRQKRAVQIIRRDRLIFAAVLLIVLSYEIHRRNGRRPGKPRRKGK